MVEVQLHLPPPAPTPKPPSHQATERLVCKFLLNKFLCFLSSLAIVLIGVSPPCDKNTQQKQLKGKKKNFFSSFLYLMEEKEGWSGCANHSDGKWQ